MLLAAKKIKMDIIPGCALAIGGPKTPNVYTIVLSCGRRKLVIPQADRKRKMPNIATILDAFLEEAALYEQHESYAAWCEECGCAPEEELAIRQYRQAGWYARALRELLGNKLYALSVEDWRAQRATKFDDDTLVGDMAA